MAIAHQAVTAMTKKNRKVQTIDGATFELLSTFHHDVTNELMARVIDENGKAWIFYAIELKVR
ncbi:hypothetical protein Desaci_1384 [Desulfosporosinus acidiphilus SJ4]|uniref:Uncharacterized protein n=1 Tax=Desulfosporosinus acidiphilus (strain DSM 22704 / JCM 16185 / SJ4) TaxID=646529 RepID=I4D3N3_DESAJ|nr:hypothetical protein [Desulfosporosinus acidiphilus]AFM40407.1 hypothetical protein Desaci_1384 [Desulfosporosinus acidiphilus SJ4]